MQPQDDRPLWELLDRARSMEAPGHFADDVLRRIRLEAAAATQELGFGGWLAQSWKALTGLSGLAALLAFAMIFQENRLPSRSLVALESRERSNLMASVQINEISDLGDLDTGLDDNDIWLGTEPY